MNLNNMVLDDSSEDDDKVEQYVFVEAVDEEDDEMVIVPSEDFPVQHVPGLSVPSVNDKTKVYLIVPDDSIGCDTKENNQENECIDDHRHDSETDEDEFDNGRKKIHGAMLILLIVTLLLFDAGDLYIFYGRSSVNSYVSPACKAMKEKIHDSLVVSCDCSAVNCSPCQEPIPESVMTTAFHYDGSQTVWYANYSSGMQNEHDPLVVAAPMIPTVRPVIVTQPNPYSALVVQQPRVSIEVIHQYYRDRSTSPSIAKTNIPMKSLIPYRVPGQKVPMPSIAESQNWLPTFHWNKPDTKIHDHLINPAFVIHPQDRRPISNEDVHDALHERRFVEETNDYIALTQHNFYEMLHWHENVLVTMYYPCERYEAKFIPIWKNLTSLIQNENLPIITASLDCHSHPNICREQRCYRYPTIRWYNKGRVYIADITRGRNANKLLRFIKKKLNEIHELNSKAPFMLDVVPIPSPRRNKCKDTTSKKKDIEIDSDTYDVDEEEKQLKSKSCDSNERPIPREYLPPDTLQKYAVTSSPCPIHKKNDILTKMIK